MRTRRQPVATWEYREFDLPRENADVAFLDWVREGWELVGIHSKAKGQRKPLPVAIVRRERAQVQHLVSRPESDAA